MSRGFQVRPIKGTSLWSIGATYFSPKLKAVAYQIPGLTWDSKRRLYVGYPDAMEPAVEELRKLGLRSEDAPENERRWPHQLLVSYDGVRDYQREGIDFLINRSSSGALLADDMGIGKSLQATKAARALRRKTLIVCPAHVRGVWERPKGLMDKGGELVKWWPQASVHPPYGTKATPIPEDADVVVIHYDIIHAWVDVILEWSDGKLTSIFDEAHVLLNPTSRRSGACREIAHDSLGRMALTGTPPTDRVRDLYNIVDTISPGRFGEFFPYALRYCNAHKEDVPGPDNTTKTVWNFDGKSNLKELRRRLDWFVLRRTKREVLNELPALQRQIVDVRVPAKNVIGMTARIVEDKRQMRMALDSAADGKLKHVVNLVRSHLEGGARVVVGTYRRAVCEKLSRELAQIAPTAFIHGGIPITRRQRIIDKLKKVEGPCCMIANIDCTSTGIDLTFASVGVIAELVWEPRDLVQWESRMHRFGASTTEPVIMQYVIARGTGDELILQAVINKLDTFLDLVETDEGDGLKETLKGEKDEGLSRLSAALKKMGQASAKKTTKKGARKK